MKFLAQLGAVAYWWRSWPMANTQEFIRFHHSNYCWSL